jgi:hypothetical protein
MASPGKDSVMAALLWWAIGAAIFGVVVCAVAWMVMRRRKVRSPLPAEFKGRSPFPPPVGDNVQFTVYRPRAVVPDRWYTLIAFAHLAAKRREAPAEEPDPIEEVTRQAVRVLGEREASTHHRITQDALQAVPREETLTFVPNVPGVEFNPPLRTFRWSEEVHREEFRLRAGPDLVGQTARGRLSVFLGDILLAEVSLAIPIDPPAETPGDDAPTETEHARRYRKIFASYSHRDLHVVEQIERLAWALGDEYLRDWKHLRAGEMWDERLLQMIEEADVFQLFWSRHAMQSPYVQREYEHALSLNRPNFVRPTYWEDPLPSDPSRNLPPETLLRLYFQRIGPFLLPAVGTPPPPRRPLGGMIFPGPGAVPGYEIQSEVGMGAMGSVVVARDRQSGHRVVIKSEHLDDLAVFGSEVPLRHPGIVPILALGEFGFWRYTVKPYLEGGTLDQRLKSGPMSAQQAAKLVLSLAEAVQHAHNWGIYHLNLKPSKVLFDSAGSPSAIGFHHIRLQEGQVFGTPAYMAPEQATGETARLGPPTDVYALGLILYECLTSQSPFRGESMMEMLEQVRTRAPVPPRQLSPKIPYDLEAICLLCLRKEPENRYATCAALANDLRRFLSAEPISCRPLAFWERCGRYCVHHRRLVGVVVLALIVTLAAVLWLSIQ